MKSQETDALIKDKLKEIARQNEQIHRSKLELMRLTHPENEIVLPATDDPGFWAAGYFTLSGHGVYADFEGKFTSERGNFHINGQLYGLIGGTSSGAAVLCVYNPLADHFFDTDLAAALTENFTSTTIQFLWNVLPVATLTGPSFGALAGLGGTLRVTKY